MRVGLLNRLVRLQAITSTTDSDGFVTESWTDLAQVWANINPVGAIEGFEAAQTQEKVTHQVTIRWRADVSAHMRFIYTDVPGGVPRIFLIHSMLDPMEARRELDCQCQEFVTTQVGAT